MKARRLATNTHRDTDWQAQEYRRLMGDEAADRQEREAKLERGECTCHRVTIKTRGVFRTIHERSCTKWKPYMEEHEAYAAERRSDGHRQSGKAHAAAARGQRHDGSLE